MPMTAYFIVPISVQVTLSFVPIILAPTILSTSV